MISYFFLHLMTWITALSRFFVQNFPDFFVPWENWIENGSIKTGQLFIIFKKVTEFFFIIFLFADWGENGHNSLFWLLWLLLLPMGWIYFSAQSTIFERLRHLRSLNENCNVSRVILHLKFSEKSGAAIHKKSKIVGDNCFPVCDILKVILDDKKREYYWIQWPPCFLSNTFHKMTWYCPCEMKNV